MSEQGWREFLAAPASWVRADRAGNRVCIAAWPDGSNPLDPQ
jgi:4a-hydroxytetrahydrobiopterin dehydratase